MEPQECYNQVQAGLFQLFNAAVREGQLRQELIAGEERQKGLLSNQDWNARQLAELEQAVAEFIDKHKEQLIVYGARAVNFFLPDYLKVETGDWDFFLRKRSTEELSRVCTLATDFLQERFPERRVWRRNSFHNPNGSFAVLVSQRHVLDFSVPPEALPEPELHSGYLVCPLDWLINNIEALLVNANAAYRAKKDRNKLLRLLWAASDNQLQGSLLRRSYCMQVLTNLGEAGRPLIEKLVTAKEQKQELEALQKTVQDQEKRLAKQTQELGKAQQKLNLDKTAKLEEELRQLKKTSSAKIAELQKANSRLQTKLELESKSREKLALEQKLEQAKHENALQEKNLAIEQLNERVAELTLRVEDSVKLRILEEKLHEVIQENKKIKVDYHVKAESVESLRSSVEAENERQRLKISQLETNLASSNKRARESIVQILEQKKHVDAMTERIAKMDKDLSESEQNRSKLHERYLQLRREVESAFCERGITVAFGYIHWAKEAKQAGFKIVINGEDSTVWLCESCQDGSTRLPEQADPCAVLKLQLGKSDITMPVKQTGTLYSICNSCFYQNLLAKKTPL